MKQEITFYHLLKLHKINRASKKNFLLPKKLYKIKLVETTQANTTWPKGNRTKTPRGPDRNRTGKTRYPCSYRCLPVTGDFPNLVMSLPFAFSVLIIQDFCTKQISITLPDERQFYRFSWGNYLKNFSSTRQSCKHNLKNGQCSGSRWMGTPGCNFLIFISSLGRSPEEIMHYPRHRLRRPHLCLSFLMAYIFQMIWWIWFIFGMIIDIGPIYPAMAYRSHRIKN